MKNRFFIPDAALLSLLALSFVLTGCGKGFHLTEAGTQTSADKKLSASPSASPNSNPSPGDNAPIGANIIGTSSSPGDVKIKDGKDGTQILLGTIEPKNDLGNENDLYLNASSGDLFRKSGGSWALKINLKGPKGDAGPAGIQGPKGDAGAPGEITNLLHFGSEMPAVGTTLPVNSLYLNTATGNLYLVKADQTLTPLMNLKGPAGDQGADGTQLLNGPGAPTAGLGKLLDLYLEETSGDLYRKVDATTWKVVLRLGTQSNQTNPPAPALSAGDHPPTTLTLPLGGVYLDVQTGNLYQRSPDGTINLLMCIKGADGKSGTSILNGPTAPTRDIGSIGDLFLDQSTHDLYQKTDGSTWTVMMNLVGPAGPAGKEGKDGKDGNSITVTPEPATPPPSIPLSLKDTQLGFEHNVSVLGRESAVKLIQTAKVIEKYSSSIQMIDVVGQTDKTGADVYNLKLSKDRASSVARALIHGALSSRLLQVSGMGEPEVSSCAPNDDCAEDRKVEIRINLKDGLTPDERNQIVSGLNVEFESIWK